MRRGSGFVTMVLCLAAWPALAQPDLSVGLLWGTEENDNCVTQVHYILQVLNEGDEPSGPFTMHVVFDAPELPLPADVGLYKGISHLVEEPIEPGGMFQVELWWKEAGGVPAGYWTSWLFLDLHDDLAELDEENNTEGPIYLHTEDIECDPENLTLESLDVTVTGSDIDYLVTVTNSEAGDVPDSFRIDLYRHRESQPGYYDPGDEFTMVEGLAAGESTTFAASWDGVDDGVYEAYAVVDGDNVVFETTEADNIVGPVIVVVCTECPDCVDGEKVTGACRCGGEPVGDGWCCDGVHVAKDCASLVEEASPEQGEAPDAQGEDDLSAEEVMDGPVDAGATDLVPTDTGAEPPSRKDSGCGAGAASLPGAWLLLMLGLGLGLSRRRRDCR
jgi:hypothetical protein